MPKSTEKTSPAAVSPAVSTVAAAIASGAAKAGAGKSAAKVKAAVKAAIKNASETRPARGGKADAKSDAKTDAKANPDANAKTEAKANPKANAKTEAKATPKTNAKSDAKTKPKTDAKIDAKVDAKIGAKAEAKAEADPAANPSADAIANARQAGLRYVHDDRPGITREPAKTGFSYRDPDGKPLRDVDTLARIKALAIPPAWQEVWISQHANGHIQATGRDVKGRKQYRYHARWRSVRDEQKYDRMIGFGRALPALRKKIDAALSLPGLPREKVLATLVHLLQATMMRIGNEEYARVNKSFGLTTLRDKHVQVSGAAVEFSFRGKSGVNHEIRLSDARLARILKRMRDLPGQELFQYVDEEGQRHTIGSSDVNDYLRELTGEDYTAKDFRTWSGTVLAALALQEFEKFDSEAQAKKNIVQAIESVAKKLGNTPAICRKCYVHPRVIDAYLDGVMLDAFKKRTCEKLDKDLASLTAEEGAVLAFLQERLAA